METQPQNDEPNYSENKSSYADIISLSNLDETGSKQRILGKLEGFMQSGLVIPNKDLQEILNECNFEHKELLSLKQAQSKGLRKGLDLNYNTEQEFWEAHAERIKNFTTIFEYQIKE